MNIQTPQSDNQIKYDTSPSRFNYDFHHQNLNENHFNIDNLIIMNNPQSNNLIKN